MVKGILIVATLTAIIFFAAPVLATKPLNLLFEIYRINTTLNSTDINSTGYYNITSQQCYYIDNVTERALFLNTFNATYDALITDNSSWNETLAGTLYAPIGAGNDSWNETLADTRYYGKDDNILGFYNVTTLPAYPTADNTSWNESHYRSIWNATNSSYEYWTNASLTNTYNSTYDALKTDNASWNESRYMSIWNATNESYYLKSNPMGFYNTTTLPYKSDANASTITCSGTDKISAYDNATGVLTCSADATGEGGNSSWNETYYRSIWNATNASYEYWTNSSLTNTYNSTYDALVTDNASWNEAMARGIFALTGEGGNASWNESHADTLYYSITNPDSFIATETDPKWSANYSTVAFNNSGYYNITAQTCNVWDGYSSFPTLYEANISDLKSYLLVEADPTWNANYTLFNASWSTTYNATYDTGSNATWNQTLASSLYYGKDDNALKFYNSTTLTDLIFANNTTQYCWSGNLTACGLNTSNASYATWLANYSSMCSPNNISACGLNFSQITADTLYYPKNSNPSAFYNSTNYAPYISEANASTKAAVALTYLTGLDNATGAWTTAVLPYISDANISQDSCTYGIQSFSNSTGAATCSPYRGDANVSATTCDGTDKVSGINNATGEVTCTSDETGASGYTSDANISTVSAASMLGLTGLDNATGVWNTQWFGNANMSTQTAASMLGLVGINNATGVWTRQWFGNTNVSTQTATANLGIVSIDNATGAITRQWFNNINYTVANHSTDSCTYGIASLNNATGAVTCAAYRGNMNVSTQTSTSMIGLTGLNNVTGVWSTQWFGNANVSTTASQANKVLVGFNNATGLFIQESYGASNITGMTNSSLAQTFRILDGNVSGGARVSDLNMSSYNITFNAAAAGGNCLKKYNSTGKVHWCDCYNDTLSWTAVTLTGAC